MVDRENDWRAVGADHHVAGMQVTVHLAVDENVVQHGVEQALQHLRLELPALRARHPRLGIERDAVARVPRSF